MIVVDVVVVVIGGRGGGGGAGRDQPRRWRALAAAVAPADPLDHRRPGDAERGPPDDQAEVAGLDHDLVQLGHGGGRAPDAADRGGAAHLVAIADEVQDRRVDVGQRHAVAVDDDAARRHPVGDDDLVDELAQRRAGPGHEAVAAEEESTRLALLERLPIVQLAHELDQLRGLLARRQQLEARGRQESGQASGALERLGDQPLRAGDQALDQLIGETDVAVDVDRAAHRDDGREARAAAERGGLVREHAALRVAGEVDVASGRGANAIDRVGHRPDVIVEGAVHAAGLALGRAEVDHPDVDAGAGQERDRADVGRDVVDLRRHHQRRDQQQRRRAGGGLGLRVVVAQLVDGVLVEDVERGAVGRGQAAGAHDLERVLPGQPDPAQAPTPLHLLLAARGSRSTGRTGHR